MAEAAIGVNHKVEEGLDLLRSHADEELQGEKDKEGFHHGAR